MTIQDQYLDSFRQTQETWAGVVEYFTKDLQRTFEQPFNPFAVIDPNETIDQIFDFWGKSLEVQRDVVKQLVSTTLAATEKVREQVESARPSRPGPPVPPPASRPTPSTKPCASRPPPPRQPSVSRPPRTTMR